MAIDFHNPKNKTSYSERKVDQSWKDMANRLVDINGKSIVDIGCGGGLYTKALMDMGAAKGIGVDFSLPSIETAEKTCVGIKNVTFQQGNALGTPFSEASFDVVLERALIHHIETMELPTCAKEAHRLLKPGGVCVWQDRTPEDVQQKASVEHLRGYLFEKYPALLAVDTRRRHLQETVLEALGSVDFSNIQSYTLWETRGVYANKEALKKSFLRREGRSILHELSDAELNEFTDYLLTKLNTLEEDHPLIDRDRWTIWVAQKPY